MEPDTEIDEMDARLVDTYNHIMKRLIVLVRDLPALDDDDPPAVKADRVTNNAYRRGGYTELMDTFYVLNGIVGDDGDLSDPYAEEGTPGYARYTAWRESTQACIEGWRAARDAEAEKRRGEAETRRMMGY